MPIIVDGSAAATPTPAVDSGQISFLRATQMVASAIGDAADTAILEEAANLILASLEELSLHKWEFLRRIQTISVTSALGADYSLNSDFVKVYDLRFTTGSQVPLTYLRQRDYDRMSTSQTTGTPTHYTLFPGSAQIAADPQHSTTTIRFIPGPSASATAVLKYYRGMAIVDDDGDTLDLPRRYQYWPVYQAKAMILADHGKENSRISYWQGKADRLISQMKSDDQEETDEDLGFMSQRESVGAFDRTHPYAALAELDGF